ncbi:MAG: L,D-transpeptidase [Caldilineaceae bacterium]|nr:L,D-transpeptidase [Caldilineaceae bacterium]
MIQRTENFSHHQHYTYTPLGAAAPVRGTAKHRFLQRYQAHLQPKLLFIGCCALLFLLLQTEVGLGQTVNADEQDGRVLARALTDSHESTPSVAAAKPPLPFRGPQIGPLIKQYPMDDIARRTTAFIPQSIEALNLTPVEAPEEEKWIRVDLSEQLVIAYQNDVPIRGFVISSGLARTPTVQGEFRIRTKVREQTMYGGVGAYAYNLPGVEWVQYFFEDYSFHGTYWHSNFGNPMSHGCINMTNADAKWLFDWAGPVWDGETTWYRSSEENQGTLVVVTE